MKFFIESNLCFLLSQSDKDDSEYNIRDSYFYTVREIKFI